MPGQVKIDVIVEAAGAEAEARKVNKAIDNIGNVAAPASKQAAEGLTGVEEAAAAAGEALGVSEEVIQDVAEAAGDSEEGFSKMTTQVRTSGTIFEGYDAVLQAVIGSIGGISVGTALLISLGGALVQSLVSQKDAKQKVLELDEKAIEVDALRAEGLQRVLDAQREGTAVTVGTTRANADFVTALRIVADAQKEHEKSTKKLAETLQILETQGRVTMLTMDRAGFVTQTLTKSSKDLQIEIANLNQKVGEQEAAMEPALNTVRSLKDLYGLTSPQVLDLARKFKLTEEAVRFLDKQLEVDASRLQDIADAMKEASGNAGDFVKEIIKLRGELAQLSVPELSLGQTTEGIDRLQAAVLRGTSEALELGVGGTPTRIADFKALAGALRPTLESLDEALKRNTNSASGYKQAISELEPTVRKLLLTHFELEKAYKAAFDSSDDAARAAKQLAQVEAQLAVEAKRAQVALETDVFARREKEILLNIEARKEELARNNQLTERNIDSLRIIEISGLNQIVRDKLKVQEDHDRQIRRKQIELIADEVARRRAALALDVQDFARSEREKGVIVSRVTEFRRTEEEKLRSFTFDAWSKTYKQLEEAMADSVEAANRRALQSVKEVNEEFGLLVEEFERRQNRISDLQSQFSLPGLSFDIHPEQLDRVAALMGRLEVTVRDVDAAFGSSSISIDQFEARLNILAGASDSAIDKFTQLIDVQQVFLSVINTITSAIAGAVAGTDNLGRALLVGFLRIVSEIALTLGTLFALAAAGFIVLPGFQWTGGQLAAAAVALLAFGAVVGGVAQSLSRSSQQAAQGGGAASTGGGVTGGGGARPPNVIPFPTSGPNPNGNVTVIQLDREGTKDFLDGHQVVTLPGARGRQNRALRRAIAS